MDGKFNILIKIFYRNDNDLIYKSLDELIYKAIDI